MPGAFPPRRAMPSTGLALVCGVGWKDSKYGVSLLRCNRPRPAQGWFHELTASKEPCAKLHCASARAGVNRGKPRDMRPCKRHKACRVMCSQSKVRRFSCQALPLGFFSGSAVGSRESERTRVCLCGVSTLWRQQWRICSRKGDGGRARLFPYRVRVAL